MKFELSKHKILLSLLISLFLSPDDIFANRYSDSISAEIAGANAVEQIDMMNNLAEYSRFISVDYADSIARATLVFAEKLNYSYGIAQAQRNIARAFWQHDEIDSAKTYFDKALDNFFNLDSLRQCEMTYRLIGEMYLNTQEYFKALTAMQKGLSISYYINDSLAIAATNIEIAWMYNALEDYERASQYINISLKILNNDQSETMVEALTRASVISKNNKQYAVSNTYLLKALAISRTIGFEEGLIWTYRYLGDRMIEEKENKAAIDYYTKAVNICLENQLISYLGGLYTLISHVHGTTGDMEKSFLYNFKALHIRKKFGDLSLISSSMSNIAGLYIATKQYDSAKYYLNEALIITKSINHKFYLSRNYMMLSKVAETEGHFRLALDYKIKYQEAKKQIIAGTEDNSIQKLRIQFEDQIREKEKQMLLREKQFETYLYASILIIMAVIIFLLMLGSVYKKRSNQKLSAQVEQRTVELNKSNIDLTEAIKSKTEFADKLSANKNELASVFAALNDKIFVFDRETVFLKVAPTNTDQLVFPVEQLLGKKIEDLFPIDDLQIVVESIQSCIDEQSVKNIIYSLFHNEENKWYNAVIAPLGDGRAMFVSREITELKKAENEIVMLNLMLESKVRERSDELRATLNKLEAENEERLLIENRLRRTNADKNKFFSIIADDLKTPFTSLANSSELLNKYIEMNDYESINKRIGLLDSEINIVGGLLENLLTWSRAQIDSIRYSPETINMNRFFREVLSKTETHAKSKGISILVNFSEDIRVLADKNMLDIIIRNIISNAVKYTPPKGMVFCTASTENSFVKIKIRDTGIGISSENLNRLFKIDSKYVAVGTASEIGSGLGLIICKEFIARNGGRIDIASTSGKGTVVSLYLPEA